MIHPCPTRTEPEASGPLRGKRVDTMDRVTTIPAIQKTELPETCPAILRIHDGSSRGSLESALQPGAELASAGFDPQELDELFARRILLETIAVSVNVPAFGPAQREMATLLLGRLRQEAAGGDIEAWFETHNRFHTLLTSASGAAMQHELRSLSDRTTHCTGLYRLADATWHAANHAEHQHIFDALIEERQRDALVRIAHHLARTALRIIGDHAPRYDPMAIRHAIDLVNALPTS